MQCVFGLLVLLVAAPMVSAADRAVIGVQGFNAELKRPGLLRMERKLKLGIDSAQDAGFHAEGEFETPAAFKSDMDSNKDLQYQEHALDGLKVLHEDERFPKMEDPLAKLYDELKDSKGLEKALDSLNVDQTIDATNDDVSAEDDWQQHAEPPVSLLAVSSRQPFEDSADNGPTKHQKAKAVAEEDVAAEKEFEAALADEDTKGTKQSEKEDKAAEELDARIEKSFGSDDKTSISESLLQKDSPDDGSATELSAGHGQDADAKHQKANTEEDAATEKEFEAGLADEDKKASKQTEKEDKAAEELDARIEKSFESDDKAPKSESLFQKENPDQPNEADTEISADTEMDPNTEMEVNTNPITDTGASYQPNAEKGSPANVDDNDEEPFPRLHSNFETAKATLHNEKGDFGDLNEQLARLEKEEAGVATKDQPSASLIDLSSNADPSSSGWLDRTLAQIGDQDQDQKVQDSKSGKSWLDEELETAGAGKPDTKADLAWIADTSKQIAFAKRQAQATFNSDDKLSSPDVSVDDGLSARLNFDTSAISGPTGVGM